MSYRKKVIIIFEVFTAIKQTFVSFFFWMIGYPLSFVIKRDPNLIVVLGRPGKTFADNSKYFFVYASELLNHGYRVVFLTSDPSLKASIGKAGGKALLHPTTSSLYTLLKCSFVVTDSLVSGYYPLIKRGVKLVQIWHGTPLKHIELDIFNKRLTYSPNLINFFVKIQKKIIGRYPAYDIVAATSRDIIKETFQRCFKARKLIATGYPRNDILFGWPNKNTSAWKLAGINVDLNTISLTKQNKVEGKTVCLYAPTYRKNFKNPFESVIDLTRMSEFALKNKLLIVLKLHPCMHGWYKISEHPSLIEYDPLGDIYPLMPMCDILITDYSSIYFDFLLLNRPIIFFAYDLESYINEDSEMYFDYNSMTPGPKCRNQQGLENELKAIINRAVKDEYEVMRRDIRSFVHDHIDNQSSRRIINVLIPTN